MKITDRQAAKIEVLYEGCANIPQNRIIISMLQILGIQWGTIAVVDGKNTRFYISEESVEDKK